MKLLIVTQKVDKEDPILGFFHSWISEMAKWTKHVTVIGQQVGKYDLPRNVSVLSLGKESQVSKIRQVIRFRHFIKNAEYDVVFVHMVPIWVFFGASIWKKLKKPVYLWYEARGARWPLRYALKNVDKVFSASRHGMPIETDNSVITGHGIDTNVFKFYEGERKSGLLISVGRITKAKRIDLLLQCLEELPSTYKLHLVGTEITDEDKALRKWIEKEVSDKGFIDRVKIEKLPPHKVSEALSEAEIFIHASETALDKAVLEAMAVGCIPVSLNEATYGPGFLLHDTEPKEFSARIEYVHNLPESEKAKVRTMFRSEIERNHSLSHLAMNLVHQMYPKQLLKR